MHSMLYEFDYMHSNLVLKIYAVSVNGNDIMWEG